MEYLAAPVLHVAIPWAQRPARCGRGCPDNAAHDCADWTSNHRPATTPVVVPAVCWGVWHAAAVRQMMPARMRFRMGRLR